MARIITLPIRPESRVSPPWVGVYLTWLEEFGWHAGLIYQGRTDTAYALHLVGHKRLKHELPPPSGWCLILDIDPLRVPTVVAMLRIIGKQCPGSIPYGFSDPGRDWFNDQGAFSRQASGEGLTCSSFVLAALDHAGISLAELNSWPAREDDDQSRNDWVARLQERRKSFDGDLAAHFDSLAKLPVGFRCRLLELFGAASASAKRQPAGFKHAVRKARVLEQCVRSHYPDGPPL